MTFRTKSKTQQWMLWLCAALVGVAIYVVLSQVLYNSVSWNVFLPHYQRILLPILALYWLFAWETRWDGERRDKEAEGEGQEAAGEVGGEPKVASGSIVARRKKLALQSAAAAADLDCSEDQSQSADSTDLSELLEDTATGEELFNRASGIKHQVIPTFDDDGDYLELLGRSAAAGYGPALEKLGIYAMRRTAWVEAYYWMKQAERNGVDGLTPVLRIIRTNWALDGFPRQSSNVNDIFTAEAGALGRALIRFDSGREAAKAKKFLMEHYPQFVV